MEEQKAMLYCKNRLFVKHGHQCEVTYTLDEFPMFIPSDRWRTRFRRALVRMRMCSEINNRGNYYLRSQGAVAKEHYRHLKYLYMIHPFSDFRLLWEVFMTIIFLLQFYTIPIDLLTYKLSNMTQFEATNGFIITRACLDFICLIDCGINFITGFYDEKRKDVVLEPKKVARHYLQTYFLIDAFSSIPTHFELVLPMTPEQYTVLMVLQYASLLKLIRFATFRTYCQNLAESLNLSNATVVGFIGIIVSALVMHLICCIFLFIFGSYFFVDDKMIYTFTKNEKRVVTTGYMHTLYQVTLVICTSGYGTEFEYDSIKMVVMWMWIFSKVFYIFLLARIMSLVMAKSSASHKYVEIVRQLKEYMRYKQLPEYMQQRLVHYYEYKFQKTFFKENEILETISGALRQEITLHNCRKLVESVPFFKNLPIALLVKIVSRMVPEIFLVNDVVVRVNTPGDSMYFISSGTVAVYTKSGKEVCHLEDGGYFGEIALVMNNEMRIASVVAVEITELYRLDRKDFVKAICPYPDLMNNVVNIAADRFEKTAIIDEQHKREIASRMYQGNK